MTAQKKITTAAQAIVARIDAVVEQAGTVQETIQGIAIDVILHAYKHGDYTLANTLVTKLPDGVRKVALVEWFKRFGGLTADAKGFNGWAGAEHIKANIEGAKKTKWWTLKPEAPFAGYDLKAKLEALIKAATKAAQDKHALEAEGDTDKAGKINVDSELLSQLGKLLAK